MENEIEYMQVHPPRCIGNQGASPNATLKNFLFYEVGDNSTCFSPECECGNRKFNITRPVEFGITSITCSDCGKKRTLFDPTKYGYDGELGLNADLEIGEVESYACPKCGNTICEVAIAFQYSGETDILEEDDAPEVNPEDLFGWVMIAAKCDACDEIGDIAGVECA